MLMIFIDFPQLSSSPGISPSDAQRLRQEKTTTDLSPIEDLGRPLWQLRIATTAGGATGRLRRRTASSVTEMWSSSRMYTVI